jgi:hypothetical protein
MESPQERQDKEDKPSIPLVEGAIEGAVLPGNC